MKNSIDSLDYKWGKVIINLKLRDLPEYTNKMPNTVAVLENYLPTIFENKCFNGKGLSFYDEVKNTETAHLLEHIILEIMCIKKTKYCDCAEYDGRTYWDTRDKSGKYQIRIKCPLADWPLFHLAFSKGLTLVDQMYKKPANYLELPKS